MDNKNEIREAIEHEIGEILAWEQFVPGVYYVAVRDPEFDLTQEYYVLYANHASISEYVKNHGKSILSTPNVLAFDVCDMKSGKFLLEYEAYRYLLANKLPLPENEDIRDVTAYGREYHPEYFGDHVVPIKTPLGLTLRYRRLMFGTFLIETDQMLRGLAVCNPIYSCDLTDFTIEKGQEADDQMPESFQYLIYTEASACLALYELA